MTSHTHYRRPDERPFTHAERDHVTCLLGGLTRRHDALLEAGMQGLGLRAERLPCPTRADYHAGRECCNPGMCNPAYFTIGALVNYLRRLRDQRGLPPETIVREYVFVTAGSKGPCRFGMYEAEYRQALKNAGFDGFRVLVFQQKDGLLQSKADAGLVLDATFGHMFLNAVLIGDILNDLANQIRPYEVHAGETQRVFDAVLDRACTWMRAWGRRTVRPGVAARLLGRIIPGLGPVAVQRVFDQLLGRDLLDMLAAQVARVDAIEVDYLRPKPVCKVTGEFWAKLTEGDGNFRMFEFLESQGAEVRVEPFMAWVDYLLYSGRRRVVEQWRIARWHRKGMSVGARCLWQWSLLWLAQAVLDREYRRLRRVFSDVPHPLADQAELWRLGSPYYNPRIAGGEGHVEIATTIRCFTHKLAHLVLSLKPFGCMPSTQSDGVQAAVVEHCARNGVDALFLPVETSGEGEVHAHSRVQMALSDAKEKCLREFEACVARTGQTVEALRRFSLARPATRRALQVLSDDADAAGLAARFALHCGTLLASDTAPETEKANARPWPSPVETKPERISS